MPFVDRSTLTYPATNAFPVRKWLDHRNPVSGTNGDYRNFEIFDLWINEANRTAWIMVGKTAVAGFWIQMASSGTGILTITGNSGGAVGPDGSNNINVIGAGAITIVGSPSTNTLTASLSGNVATEYDEDTGVAVPSGGILNVKGGSGVHTSGAGNTITITATGAVPLMFTEDSGSATPSLNNINVFGGTGISTSGSGSTITISLDDSVANNYTCDTGTAVPSANNLNVFGGGGTHTSGSGSTITITSTGGGLTWHEITVVGPTQMNTNSGYIANISSPSQVGLLLPMTANQGDIIKVVGKGTGAFQVQQNSGQTIHYLSNNTTTGGLGTLTSNDQYGTIELVCITANTDWIIDSSMGNFNIV